MSGDVPEAGGHAEPQQYYTINAARLSWQELWYASGPAGFVLMAPIVAVLKALRMPLTVPDRMPREVTLQPVEETARAACERVVQPSVAALEALGFEHFTTFSVPELPHETVVFGLLNRSRNAYANIFHLTPPRGRARTVTEIGTLFRDGGSLWTVNGRDAMALAAPPPSLRELVAGASPDRLWEAHQRRLVELAPRRIDGPVGPDHYVAAFRRFMREQADYHVQRRVFVPV